MVNQHCYRFRCNTVTLFILLHICTDASEEFQHEFIKHQYYNSEQHNDKLKWEETPNDQKLTVRLPLNTLLKYTSYKDVSILHFRVPSDSKTAFFKFKAYEESKGGFQKNCKPKDVTLHLKANSFPVISPDNITFSKHFKSSLERYKIYDLQFRSDQMQHSIDISGPQIGSWFAIAFVSWTDPINDRIEQQGLSTSCDTILFAELAVTRVIPVFINQRQIVSGNLSSLLHCHPDIGNDRVAEVRLKETLNIPTPESYQLFMKEEKTEQQKLESTNNSDETVVRSNPNLNDHEKNSSRSNVNYGNFNKSCTTSESSKENIYKFFVPDNVAVATAKLKFAEVCEDCPEIGFYTKSNAYPEVDCDEDTLYGNERNYLHKTVFKANQTGEILIKFNVQPSMCHYILLKFSPSKSSRESKFDSNKVMKHSTQKREKSEKIKAKQYHLAYTLHIYFEETLPTKKSNNKSWEPLRLHGMNFYPLLRQSYHEFFMFDYDFQPDCNGTVPPLLNLTTQSPAAFAFELGEVYDIGGTLTFAISMKSESSVNDLKQMSPLMSSQVERDGILAEKLVSDSVDNIEIINREKMLRENQSMHIIICMYLGVPGIPTWPDQCRYGQRLLPASSIINNTNSMGVIHVPYPESGLWFVSMGLFCHGPKPDQTTVLDSVKDFVRQHEYLLKEMKSPCACASHAKQYASCLRSNDCVASINETETLKIKECMMDAKCTPGYLEKMRQFDIHHRSATDQHFALENCQTSVVFSIASSPCLVGRCGRFGRCYHYMSGGFVFSTCVCSKGYRGWDCSDDSQVPSSLSILTASMFLTLSNLLFIPSICLAFRRHYYTEGLIYFFAMFFSIFYHACDSGENVYNFCLVQIGVLQFCDFYCGLLAIWVTLVAMAHIPENFASLLNMLGAILLAFGTEINKQSLWVFLAPAMTGICLVSTSWGLRCAKTRKCFPGRKYLTIFLPIGMTLVMIGLVCYAFLQTKQNYHIVHSVWHMVMAMSILCLLPSRSLLIPKP